MSGWRDLRARATPAEPIEPTSAATPDEAREAECEAAACLPRGGACRKCLRRSWLLSVLGTTLDYCARDERRLLASLELDDDELIDAIAGRRAGELRVLWEHFEPAQDARHCNRTGSSAAQAGGDARGLISNADQNTSGEPRVESICRHRERWPGTLGERTGAPRALYFTGATERLASLIDAPTVAIAGSARATDYGVEMARSIARGLSASEVTVVSAFAAGIGAAALTGALEASGVPIAVMSGGADVCRPASRRTLYERVRRRGCAVAELPRGLRARRWCRAAQARTVAGLAQLTVVVEAGEGRGELTEANVAQALDRTVAAVPGRVTSPLSHGTCALLTQGTPAVRGAADVLELLFGPQAANARGREQSELAGLEPRLRALLEDVGRGRDTLGKLTSDGQDASDTMHGLSQLELKGLLARGDGGRYVPRQSLAGGG